ncbi:MAG: hypothetical protein AB7P69_00860 [Candidatus Binatia bacterium]
MKNAGKVLRKILQNPYLGLGIGGTIILASLSDALDGLHSMQNGFRLNSSHGVLLYGCIHLLKAFADLIEGVEHIDEEEEEIIVESGA